MNGKYDVIDLQHNVQGEVSIEGIGIIKGEYIFITEDTIEFTPYYNSETFITHYKSLIAM